MCYNGLQAGNCLNLIHLQILIYKNQMEQTKFTNLEVEIIIDRPEECIVECSCDFYEEDMN